MHKESSALVWLNATASIITILNLAYAGLTIHTGQGLGLDLPSAPMYDWTQQAWMVRTIAFFVLEYALAIGFGWMLVSSWRAIFSAGVYSLYPIPWIISIASGMVTIFNVRILIGDPLTTEFASGGGWIFQNQPAVDSGIISIGHFLLAFSVALLWFAQHTKNLNADDNTRANIFTGLVLLQSVGYFFGLILINILI